MDRTSSKLSLPSCYFSTPRAPPNSYTSLFRWQPLASGVTHKRRRKLLGGGVEMGHNLTMDTVHAPL